mmetsp:Transcript_14577/g.23935  ORF Transcript_14577/g.23935 Transcript_14577/m.23935 type:complete len:225 (+) Transcript_14577:675-1349(+)
MSSFTSLTSGTTAAGVGDASVASSCSRTFFFIASMWAICGARNPGGMFAIMFSDIGMPGISPGKGGRTPIICDCILRACLAANFAMRRRSFLSRFSASSELEFEEQEHERDKLSVRTTAFRFAALLASFPFLPSFLPFVPFFILFRVARPSDSCEDSATEGAGAFEGLSSSLLCAELAVGAGDGCRFRCTLLPLRLRARLTLLLETSAAFFRTPSSSSSSESSH